MDYSRLRELLVLEYYALHLSADFHSIGIVLDSNTCYLNIDRELTKLLDKEFEELCIKKNLEIPAYIYKDFSGVYGCLYEECIVNGDSDMDIEDYTPDAYADLILGEYEKFCEFIKKKVEE